MKKRLISLLMVFTMIVGLLSTAGCGEETQSGSVDGTETVDTLLTKEQWVIGLGSAFGMNEYTSDELYFTDVPEDAELYPYLQSCAEWGVFEKTGVDFKPDTLITREEAIQTAVMAAEVLEHITEGDAFEECVPYAVNAGIIESDDEDYLAENITYAQGQEILDWAVSEYQNREFVEYSNVEMKEGVEDLTQYEITASEDYSTVTVSDDAVEPLEEGDVFIAPGTMEFPYGVARKVVSVSYDEEGNQIVVTEEPALEDLYDELDFAVRAVPEADDVIVAEGVTLVSAEVGDEIYANVSDKENIMTPTVTYLGGAETKMLNGGGGGGSHGGRGKSGSSFKFEINLTKGNVKLNPEWETAFGKFCADLETDNGDEEAGKWFEKSNVIYRKGADGQQIIDDIENKFEGGYEITGAIEVEDLSVDVEVDPQKFLGVIVGIKDVEIKTNCKLTHSLKVKGEVKEEITIASVHVQTPVPGVTVNLEVVGTFTASGELELKIVATSVTTVNYSNGKIKKTSDTTANMAEVRAGIEVEAGAEVKAAACILGIKITDVSVEITGKMNFDGSVTVENIIDKYQGKDAELQVTYWKMIGKYTVPIVKLKFGYDKKSLIKIKASWELVGPDGLIKIDEKTMFETKLTTSKIVLDILDDEETELLETEGTENVENTTETGILDRAENILIETYYIVLPAGETRELNVVGLPAGYEVSELVWTSDNSSVATVNGGEVFAVAEGVAQITVSTPDGEYQAFFVVDVNSSDEIEFNPL